MRLASRTPFQRAPTTVTGLLARASSNGSVRGNVPGHDENRPFGAAQHPLSHRSLPESLPPAPPVGSKNHEIGFSGIGVKHNQFGRIALLLNDADNDPFPLRALAQAGQQVEPFAPSP